MTVRELKEILANAHDGMEVHVYSYDGENGGLCESANIADKDDGYPYMQANNYPETEQKFFLLCG